MLFNSHVFIFLFLPITAVVYYLLVNNKQTSRTPIIIAWLSLMSLFFYAWWDFRYLVLLILSILFNYSVGLIIRYANKHKSPQIRPKIALVIGISINLLALGYYKYCDFLIANITSFTGIPIPLQYILLPIGISFFTFTQIAFLVDVYRGYDAKVSFLSYLLFVTFFPHLIAGPILHHKEMMPQFEDICNLKVDWQNILVGMVIFIFGLFKKVIIADNLAEFATPIFNTVSQGVIPGLIESWTGALAYTLQLYFDFSGYSDMAIGLALLFNIRLPVNFFSPYKATSIIDFWRRWHMTLSRYLRDYLYIPLGGNRHGEYQRTRNLMVTMLLGGLWHGAGWTFIVWGGLHGAYLIINHLWRKVGVSTPWFCGWLITFISVVIAWVFFRADSLGSGIMIVKGMFGINGLAVNHFITETVSLVKARSWIFASLSIVLFMPNVLELTAKYNPALEINEKSIESRLVQYIQWNPSYLWALFVSLIAIISILEMVKVSEFLYFQF